ncbi:hypothetical protein E2C01_053710 [Portunus trituberculatus]|uniref:Uncharacterized protein n=1 Tax=Portunus trituberculatus TaxID=210409 RepID=A0A5B7GT01_PORTR|nr:hypothetical protein [Portunus trituberculatus]
MEGCYGVVKETGEWTVGYWKLDWSGIALLTFLGRRFRNVQDSRVYCSGTRLEASECQNSTWREEEEEEEEEEKEEEETLKEVHQNVREVSQVLISAGGIAQGDSYS